VLERSGQTWDEWAEPRARWDDLDPAAIARFRRLCLDKGRRAIPDDEPDETVLRKLGLVADAGPIRAALLLFGKEPQRLYGSAFVRIGRFRSETDIVDDRLFRGNVFAQIEGAMTYFRERLETRHEFHGEPAREVTWEYPLEALREAMMNAVCHRDYLDPAHLQVRWFDARIVIVNPGGLVPPLRPEDLRGPHPSRPRNKKIAEALFDDGWIEQWGSGYEKMLRACGEAGLPEPEWEERAGAFWLTFRRDILTEDYLRTLGLSERQVGAMLHVKTSGRITNAAYQRLLQVSKRTASDDLAELERRGLFERVGVTGRGTYFRLKGAAKGQARPLPFDSFERGVSPDVGMW
jgi:ATP-dependent DNA helicase RecG